MWWLWIIFGIIGLAVLGWVAWISIQSLIQASLLRGAAEEGGAPSGSDRPAAIHGRTKILDPVRVGGKGDLLWFKTVHEERRGWGRRRRWVTVGREEGTAQFRIESGGREVGVGDHPTEVQGAHSETQYGSGGFLGGMFSNQRTRIKWLPVPPVVTVVGRLETAGDEWKIVKSPKVGLLLSPHEPGKAAGLETMKGIFGLIIVAAGIGVAIWFWVNSR